MLEAAQPFRRFSELLPFSPTPDGKEHIAMIRGDVLREKKPFPVRIHSECLTGDVMGSLRCDCREQLEAPP